MSAPRWLRFFPLPTGLHPDFAAWLVAYVEARIQPGEDPHRHLIASRMAQALSRLHLAAARLAQTPPDQPPDVRWLRVEAQAQRALDAIERILLKPYRPVTLSPIVPALPPPPPDPRPSSRPASASLPPRSRERSADRIPPSIRRQFQALGMPLDEPDPFAPLGTRPPATRPPTSATTDLRITPNPPPPTPPG